ncbi:MAG: ACT domain-containing protein [Coriobacteriales bacterium]|nr:ACT domain-containing protein [Coriobacteriales bacterium]
MAAIQLRNEVIFRAPTHVGLLAEVTGAIHRAGVNILAIDAYERDGIGEFFMITDNNKDAYAALEPLGGEMDMQSVVVAQVSNAPGELAAISRKLADNDINVGYVYASAADGIDTVMIVLKTACEVDVVELLQGM